MFAFFKIVSVFVQPGCLLVLLGLLGLLLGRRPGGRWLLIVSVGGLAAILLLPLDQWLLLPLENRFPAPAKLPDQVDGIILIGGAQDVETTEARGLPSFNGEMETLTAFVALARGYPNATLAFSGGSGALGGNRISEADVSRALFEQLGLDRPVIYESTSRDTYENAVLLKRIVQPAPGKTWLLITAASHMPRSVGAFREADWPVTAWPVAYKSADITATPWRRPDLGSHLAGIDIALHEWEGLLVYRLLGRTDALFPRP